MTNSFSNPLPPPTTDAPSFSQVFAGRMRELRKVRGWSQQQLSDRLRGEGIHLSRERIAQFESMSASPQAAPAGITLDRALGICAVLGVAPARMFTPETLADPVAVTPRREAYAGSARLWIEGGFPIVGDDPPQVDRYFTAGVSIDELDARAAEAERLGPTATAPFYAALKDARAMAKP